jgi:hypothetical protein
MNINENYKAILDYDIFIFDFDGTLMDTEKYHHAAWEITLNEYFGSETNIEYDINSKTAQFTNLLAGTKYDVVITALMNESNYNSSDSSSVITLPSKPILSFSNISDTSFIVTWSGGDGATSYKYKLNDVLTIPSTDNGVASKTASFSNLIARVAPSASVNTRSSRWLNSRPTFLGAGASSSVKNSQNLILQYLLVVASNQ